MLPILAQLVHVVVLALIAPAAPAQAAVAPRAAASATVESASGGTPWCIVCDAPASDGAITEIWKGRRVTVCNEACRAQWLARQDELAPKLEARGVLFDEHSSVHGDDPSRSLLSGWMWFGFYVLAGLVCGAIAAYVALGKGLAPLPWLLSGLAFNVVALGALATKARGDLSKLPEGVPAGLRKIPATYSPLKCAKCGAANHPSARSCGGCGKTLQARVESETARATRGPAK